MCLTRKSAFQTEESVRRNSESEAGEVETLEHDPHYEPIVSLPLIEIQTNEEDEEVLVKIRARLYRYDTGDHEWKVHVFICFPFYYAYSFRKPM